MRATAINLINAGAQWHRNARDTLMYYPSPTALKDKTCTDGYFQPYYMPAGEQETRGLYLQDAMTYDALTVTAALRYDSVRTELPPVPERGRGRRRAQLQGQRIALLLMVAAVTPGA